MSDSSSSENLVPYVRARGKPMEHRKSNGDRRRDMFSDEDDLSTPSPSHSNQKFDTRKYSQPELKKNPKSGKVSFSVPPPLLNEGNHEDSDDVEQELDLFSKAIHISNIDEIDHVGLMRGMHERFQRKQLKWQRYASSYSKWSFAINFIILITQIIQMLFHQLVEVFNSISHTQDSENGYSNSRGSYYGYTHEESDFPKNFFSVSSLRALRCVLSAFTAVLAGFQMKLKLTEKSEKYRRGAKVYARLHRLSTYYLMLAENGGKVEDVTGLWRDAMKKEGKWIPVVKTFMAT